jgi:hypothetical protein
MRGAPLEFELLAACCRWPPAPELVREKAGPAVDWSAFASLVKKHRVRGLVAKAVNDAKVTADPDFARQLSLSARNEAMRSLRLAGEAVRLNDALQGGGVGRIHFLKGSSLAKLAYGSLALKESCDIDVLIPLGSVGSAFKILKEMDYVAFLNDHPVKDDEELQRLGEAAKDTMWHNESRNITVELHTRLFSNRNVMSKIPVESGVEVDLGVGKINTLPINFLLIYLAVHGTFHSWSRLKWLADYSALLNQLEEVEIWQATRDAATLNAVRSMGLALELSQQLLGARISTETRAMIRPSVQSHFLQRNARSVLIKSGDVELDDRVLGTIGINISHFFIFPGFAHKFAELKTKLQHPTELQGSPSGQWRRYLTPLIAFPRWLGRRMRRKGARIR